MKYRLVLTGMVLAGAMSTTALAAEDTGFDLGLRLGYGIPLGSLADAAITVAGTNFTVNSELNDVISGQVPIWIDAGYRFTPNFMAGIYFQYGFGFVPSNGCPNGWDCSAQDIRFGLQAQYRFMPRESFDPWLGVGFGYEWLDRSFSFQGVDGTFTVHGWEFLNLQGGVDFKVADSFGIGPFLSFSLGEYSSYSADISGLGVAGSGSGDIDNTALHEWLTLGVRGVFDP